MPIWGCPMIRVLLVALCLMLAPVAALAQGNPETARVVTDLFLNHCVAGLKAGAPTDKSALVRWSDDDVAQLANSSGGDFDGAAVWSPEQGVAIVATNAAGNPCTVFTYKAGAPEATVVWDRIAMQDGYRGDAVLDSKPVTISGYAGLQGGGFGAFIVPDSEFVQMTAAYYGLPYEGQLVLTGARVSTSQDACKLFPKECN